VPGEAMLILFLSAASSRPQHRLLIGCNTKGKSLMSFGNFIWLMYLFPLQSPTCLVVAAIHDAQERLDWKVRIDVKRDLKAQMLKSIVLILRWIMIKVQGTGIDRSEPIYSLLVVDRYIGSVRRVQTFKRAFLSVPPSKILSIIST
jgi:hypothetical protein